MKDSLCDIEDCKELARYIETGDGKAKKNPKKRCHKHKTDSGLGRDLRVTHLANLRDDNSLLPAMKLVG